MAIVVSVVVPTYKRPALLSRCLEALMAQNFDPSAYEVIVVDDAVDIETRRLVEDWARRVEAYSYVRGPALLLTELASVQTTETSISPLFTRGSFVRIPGIPLLRYIPQTGKHGPAAARNCGWQAALGEIIAFTDDDCIPDPDWLKNGVNAFKEGVVGVSGRLIVPLPARPTDYERNVAELAKSQFVTANCFYRRSVLAEAGGFDENFTMAWREDSDLFFHLLERNYQLINAPDAIVVHPVRPARWGISLAQQRRSQFNALAFKKHPRLYRQRLQANPPWDYYAIVLSLLGVFLAAGTGNPGNTLVPAAIWTGLTLRFFAQRVRHTTRTASHLAEMLVTSILIPPLSVFWRLRGAYKFRVLFL